MNSAHPDRKAKIKHELKEMLALSLYLAFFFCAIALYDMLLLRQYNVENWTIAFALLVSAVWKAFVFGLLVFVFHVVEEVIKRLIHGSDVARAATDIRLEQLAGRSIVVFCVFIPLFAWREFRRVMGEEAFVNLVFKSRHKADRTISPATETLHPE